MTYVNVYEIDREYGGPEEGGWYYDSGRVVDSRQVHGASQQAAAVREFQARYPRTNKAGTVLYAGGDYRVRVEDAPGANYPTERPHYE
jgi:hypothetical protein